MRIAGTILIVSHGAMACDRAGADRPETRQPPSNPAATDTKSHPAAAAKPNTQNDPKKKAATAQPARDLNGGVLVCERASIQFDLAWIGAYNGLITGEANDKTTAAIKAFQKDHRAQGNRHARPARARAARRPVEGKAGSGRLAHGGRPGHRGADRPADQASAQFRPGQDRHPLVFRARADSGRDLSDAGSRHHARGSVRAAEEGAGGPPHRGQPAAARLLHLVRHAGAEEILRARARSGRAKCAA